MLLRVKFRDACDVLKAIWVIAAAECVEDLLGVFEMHFLLLVPYTGKSLAKVMGGHGNILPINSDLAVVNISIVEKVSV